MSDGSLRDNACRHATLPIWWPPPDGELIGVERATELVAWLRTVAPAAVQAARDRLQHDTNMPIRTYAVPVALLARLTLAPSMKGVSVGCVSRSASSGAADTIGITLQRDGRLALTTRELGETVQRWVTIAEDG